MSLSKSLLSLMFVGSLLMGASANKSPLADSARPGCSEPGKFAFRKFMRTLTQAPDAFDKCKDNEVLRFMETMREDHNRRAGKAVGRISKNIFYVYTAYSRVFWFLAKQELERRKLDFPKARIPSPCIDPGSSEPVHRQGAKILDVTQCSDSDAKELIKVFRARIWLAKTQFADIGFDRKLWTDFFEWMYAGHFGLLEYSRQVGPGSKYDPKPADKVIMDWQWDSITPMALAAIAKSVLMQLGHTHKDQVLVDDKDEEMQDFEPFFKLLFSADSHLSSLPDWPLDYLQKDILSYGKTQWNFYHKLYDGYLNARKKAEKTQKETDRNIARNLLHEAEVISQRNVIRLTLVHSTLYMAKLHANPNLKPQTKALVDPTLHSGNMFMGAFALSERATAASTYYRSLATTKLRSRQARTSRQSGGRTTGRRRVNRSRSGSRTKNGIYTPYKNYLPKSLTGYDSTNPHPINPTQPRKAVDATNPFPIRSPFSKALEDL